MTRILYHVLIQISLPLQLEHNRLPGGDLKNVGNFAGECSVLLLPCKEVSFSFHFLGSLTLRDWFPLSNLSIVSLCIHLCTDVYCEPGIWH